MPTKGRQITYEDLEALKRELLNKLAKKKELIRLATKDDLKGLATKEELTRLATKEELKKLDEKTDRIIGIIIQMQDQMSGMETKTDAERKFNNLMNAIDQLTQKFDDLITEKSAIDHGLIRHESRLDDHEVRIHNLESTH
jgi:predicted nuclease with TOPRIM domain